MNRGSLAELLAQRAAKQPGRIGYRFFDGAARGEVSIAYRELDSRARRIACGLRREGVQNERVLLLGTTGLDFVASLFGIIYAGAIAVPLSFPRPSKASRLKAVVRDAKPKLGVWVSQATSRASKIIEQVPDLALEEAWQRRSEIASSGYPPCRCLQRLVMKLQV